MPSWGPTGTGSVPAVGEFEPFYSPKGNTLGVARVWVHRPCLPLPGGAPLARRPECDVLNILDMRHRTVLALGAPHH